MKGLEMLRRVIELTGTKLQLLPNCAISAKTKKDGSAKIEFETLNMNANDLMYWNSEDRPASREPQYVGLILWVPFKDYMAIAEPKREAVSR